MKTPIVLFVYNRPEHTRKTLDNLNKNQGIEDSTLFIFSDGPKNGDLQNVFEVRNVLKEFSEKNNFKEVKIIEQPENRGLANSIISGVTYVFKQYEEVIVLEDDLLTSVDFYKYMTEALEYYREEKRAWSIAGYSPRMKRLERKGFDVYTCPRAGSWGWATWKDRWDTIDWEVLDYNEFKWNKKLRNAFDKRSPGMSRMLDLQMEGKIDSWAIRWCYQQHKNDMYTINPIKSKVMNIGNDGTGTHNETDKKWNVELDSVVTSTKFQPLKVDKRICKEYNKIFHNPLWRRIYKRICRICCKKRKSAIC